MLKLYVHSAFANANHFRQFHLKLLLIFEFGLAVNCDSSMRRTACASFFDSSKLLSSVSFQSDCRLRRIESELFARTALQSVVLLAAIAFTAGDAFPTQCELLSASCLEFDWRNLGRQLEGGIVFQLWTCQNCLGRRNAQNIAISH